MSSNSACAATLAVQECLNDAANGMQCYLPWESHLHSSLEMIKRFDLSAKIHRHSLVSPVQEEQVLPERLPAVHWQFTLQQSPAECVGMTDRMHSS